MKNNVICVNLWGKEICRLEWVGGYKDRFGKVGSKVSFNPQYHTYGYNLDPLGIYSTDNYMVRQGLSDLCRAKDYEGLPRFLSGSLPDDWGNKVFAAWKKKYGLKSSDVSPVDKLSFIGSRGMGALEFVPQSYSPEEGLSVELGELYDLAVQIEKSRGELSLELAENPGLNDLMAIGMSAGGQHPKAIVAIDWESGKIKSGQTPLPESYIYYILKFRESGEWPGPEVEYAYYKMAIACGIEMMPSRLFEIAGLNHFLTERFDRVSGTKLHMATLNALRGQTDRYEDVFAASRLLKLPQKDINQLFRRVVFNYLSGVCDDHDKNVSFTMDERGIWRLSPAYDVTFTVNFANPLRGRHHALSVGEDNTDLSMSQLLTLAEENDVTGARRIIAEVKDAVNAFDNFASQAVIPEFALRLIKDHIDSQLAALEL